MKDGFIQVACVTPKIKVADVKHNTEQIALLMRQACEAGNKVIVFPELCITGYTCNDLFLQQLLIEQSKNALLELAALTESMDCIAFVGLPLRRQGKLYNVAACLHRGRILGCIPKKNIPTYGEFYEGRHFAIGRHEVEMITIGEQQVPFGMNQLFVCDNMEELVIGCEICEDLWVANPPATEHALHGATVIVNLSASNETVGKDSYRQLLVKSTSARLLCGYLYTSAGDGESTQDLVFGGHNLIAENGVLLTESERFQTGILSTELDVKRLAQERGRMGTFGEPSQESYHYSTFHLQQQEVSLTRWVDAMPFVPGDVSTRNRRCEEILSIQAGGLKKRLEHTGVRHAVVGLSGGLDSTLALLVTVRAFDMLSLDRSGIHCITMPCFGTTDRTYHNACRLAQILNTSLEEVDIKEAVTLHFRDIQHDINVHDVTYENGQARQRTLVLMNIANRENGLVIGTGDMSELALGWATYNGDHMSMYGVNAGVPKTLVRHLVKYYADSCMQQELSDVLMDIFDTPVSPELLPPKEGEISQKTEDLVGPYELHDFFLYHMLRLGFAPKKIYRLACVAFYNTYDKAVILKWLKVFYRRYFSQQFKRSCLPDGPKVGTVAVSPRGDLRMPSDASVSLWMAELETL